MKVVIFLLCLATVVTSAKFILPESGERFRNVLRSVEHGRIFGGVESVPHSRPFQVGIFVGKNHGSFCSGSLISSKFVMTATHCVLDGTTVSELFTIVLGAHNIYNENDGVRIQSQKAIMHPKYYPDYMYNDISLIELPLDAPINENIQVIGLPPRSAIENYFNDVDAIVSGWGSNSENNDTLYEVLRQVEAPVVNIIHCDSVYEGDLWPSQICLDTYDDKGFCRGDDGAPMTTIHEGRLIQIGIASYGRGACKGRLPQVYTRVTSFLDWISTTSGVVIEP